LQYSTPGIGGSRFNALFIALNGMGSRTGSLTVDWERQVTNRRVPVSGRLARVIGAQSPGTGDDLTSSRQF